MKIHIACSVISRLRGLLWQKEFNDILFLVPCKSIHTFGMKHPLDIAFVSKDGVVLASYRNVDKRKQLSCKNAAGTLERFSSDEPWFERGDSLCAVL